MMNIPYILYMAECEGMTDMVDTRETRVNAIIKDFIKLANRGVDINDMEVQNYLAKKYDLETLTPEEHHEISRRVQLAL